MQKQTISFLTGLFFLIILNTAYPQQQPASASYPLQMRTVNTVCTDSSFIKIYRNPQRKDFYSISIAGADGSLITGGSSGNIVYTVGDKFYGALSKFDAAGKMLWGRELRAANNYEMPISRIRELKDGSIVVTGMIWNAIYPVNSSVIYDVFIAKFSAGGNLLWFKTFNSTLSTCYQGNTSLFVKDIAEGPNGEIYIGAQINNCVNPSYLSVFALNTVGDLLWSNAFVFPDYSGIGGGIVVEGNTIVIAGSFFNAPGSTFKAKLSLLSLNRTNGMLLRSKTWQDGRPMPENASYYLQHRVQMIKTTDGNYIIHGASTNIYDASLVTRFLYAEFDTSFNFKNAYAVIPNVLPEYLTYMQSKVRSDKQFLYTFAHRYPNNDFELYTGAGSNRSISFERKQFYADANGTFNYQTADLLNDGAAVQLGTFISNTDNSTFFEYKKTHLYDTAQSCFGTPDQLARTQSYTLSEVNHNWVSAGSTTIYATSNSNVEALPFLYTEEPGCKQTFTCGTITIKGPDNVCGFNSPVTYTVSKSSGCAKGIMWKIDTVAGSILQQTNDTTLLVQFKQSWQGYLYATIEGDCSIKDSLYLKVTDGGLPPVSLGLDRELCPQSTILLNARRGYSSYRWQNGSTDSTFLVNQPGSYYVTVTDACNNIYSDTVLITASPPVPLSIGPDRTKCNNDTLRLTAPAGFMNYSWGPVYNINSTNTQQVVVNPSKDTIYYVKAEKTPGCFGFDTLRVKVNTSPPVNLGPDVRFCNGDSVVLNAGTGFVNYAWSNGAAAPQTVIKTQGTYFVKAITIEGCSSTDTMQVLQVFNNPVVQLNRDSLLCTGSSKILDAGNFASYSWSTGENTRTITVINKGSYRVVVTDANGCKGNDSSSITRILPLPARFLGKDTAICNYGTLDLVAAAGYRSYTWNNGSTSQKTQIDQPGQYILTVTDAFNCKGADTVNVALKQCLNGFYMPNAFTPNGDGLNDVIHPFLFGDVEEYVFIIFNRFGEAVFTTRDLNEGWNGKYKGMSQDPGTFTWKCFFQLKDAPKQQRSGTLHLIR